MLIVMAPTATEGQIEHVVERIEGAGGRAHLSRGEFQVVIGVIGPEDVVGSLPIEAMEGVERAVPVMKPYKFVAKEARPEPSVVEIGGVPIGGGHFGVIAGPCAVETREQTLTATKAVAASGASILRGEAFKPRSSPYSFQGLGEEGLRIMAEARRETGLPFVAEVLDPRDVEMVGSYADALRVGARNTQNFTLLAELGHQPRPVILKRGMSNTIEELLLSADYIAKGGNDKVILCERGIRSFEPATRFTLDLSAVPVMRGLTHLPIIVDPSHGSGKKACVAPLARASLAVGADGVMVDVHPNPEEALCDGPQALLPEEFEVLMRELEVLAEAMGLTVP